MLTLPIGDHESEYDILLRKAMATAQQNPREAV